MSRRFMPLSMTCVSPSLRGFPGRCGRSRNPSLKPGNDSLQSPLRLGLHVVVERAAVCVDADRERAEVLDPELPQALRHQLLPRDLLDLLDLGGLERGGAADDREVDHPVLAHRLDRLVREAALAADRAHAVLRAERLGERTIRALVVVPMQIFSYRPSPTLRTFGAVWSRNAPRRSIGGSTPWSKMRICVRSRMPMMWPWTTTSSPARSLRISASSWIGKVTSWRAIRPPGRTRRRRWPRRARWRGAPPSTGS